MSFENNTIRKEIAQEVKEFEQALLDRDKNEQALRYNQGKLEWSLVDFDSLEGLVRVLEYGKDKYTLTKELDILSLFQLCLKLEFATTVKIVSQLSHEVFVQPVIEKLPWNLVHAHDVVNIQKLIKSLCVEHAVSTSESILLVKKQTKSENISKNIEPSLSTEKKKNLERKKEEVIQSMLKKLKEETFSGDLLTTESLKSFTYQKFPEDVKSANLLQDYTLTIVIQQENTEEFCVANATTPSDCLMMILNYLKEQSVILKSITTDNKSIIISGRDNWKLGMPVTQVTESLMRHLFAFAKGEDVDPESGCRHISHVLCNAMFLEYILREKQHYDDRKPSNPNDL